MVEHRAFRLHRDALVIEAERPQSPKLLASTRTAWTAMERLGHHVAVAGVRLSDRRRDDVHPPAGIGQLQGGGGERAGDPSRRGKSPRTPLPAGSTETHARDRGRA